VTPVLARSDPLTSEPERLPSGAVLVHAPWYVDWFSSAHVRPMSAKQYAERAPMETIAIDAGMSVRAVGATEQ